VDEILVPLGLDNSNIVSNFSRTIILSFFMVHAGMDA